jgi:hypothetical protein
MGPLAETCLHLRDIARPPGLAADVPAEVRGTREAIAMAATGRAAVLGDLEGVGVGLLHDRLVRRRDG